MDKVLYKKGYLIRVNSWENDGDNPRTEEVNVVNEAEAKQLVEFAWLFKSRNSGKGTIGNIYDGGSSEVEPVLVKFYDKYPDFLGDEKPEDMEHMIDWMIERASELGLSGSEFYTRVCDGVEVLYFEQDVVCKDLSQEWK